MTWFFSESRTGKFLEGGLNLLDAAVGFGLLAGATLVTAIGNFVLGGVLGVLALAVFARLGHRKKVKAVATPKKRMK